jgi:MerR family transcriptional regulator, light-induced transcriptional regulator
VDELQKMLKQGIWPEDLPTAPSVQTTARAPPPQYYASHLFLALIQHEEARASKLFTEIQSCFDLTAMCLKILTPCLVEVGESWYRGEIHVTTEHFASGFIRGKLLTLLQVYPARKGSAYVMVGCAPTENHEIGSLMLAILLRSKGCRVEFLGPDLPIDDLVDYASFEHPDMIILSASMPYAAMELDKIQEKLNRLKPTPYFGYGGRAFNLNPGLRKTVPGIFLGETLDEVVIFIRSLLAKTKIQNKSEIKTD